MVKGVNKTIIEINEIENDFFEKIIFFVSPKHSGASAVKIQKAVSLELEKINMDIGKNTKGLRQMIHLKRRRRKIMLVSLIGALIVCVITAAVVLL